MGFDSGAGGGGGGGSGDVATDAIYDAKGDLPVGTGANTAARLPVGAAGKVLTADPAESSGVKWANAPGGYGLIVPVGRYIAPAVVSATSGAGTEASMALVRLAVPVDMSLDSIGTDVTIAGGTGALVRLVLYVDADGDGVPDTLLVDAGTIDGTVTGFAAKTIAVDLEVGSVWGAAIPQGAASPVPGLRFSNTDIDSALLMGTAPAHMNVLQANWYVSVAGAAPGSITPSFQQSSAPRWAVRRSA